MGPADHVSRRGDDPFKRDKRGPLYDAAIRSLCEAVRIPTIVGDNMEVIGKDPAWDIFYKFTAFLKTTFPRVHETLEHTIINEHSHLYTWKGTDPSLKPILLMAHSDVVPVAPSSEQTWTYDPFSGYCDGKYVWGRGSEDNKSNLITQLSVIEQLITSSWKPTRTILLSFGHDEEGGADQSYGAQFLAKHILETYGRNSIQIIFDESVASVKTYFGKEVALAAIAEKGYVDVEIQVHCPGGHSSWPPKHTAIGYLAQAINLLEKNQLPPLMSRAHPHFQFLDAISNSPTAPDTLRSALNSSDPTAAISKYLENDDKGKALFVTTTAATVIEGGDKVNSLPEMSRALINHRIGPHDTVQTVKDHYLRLLGPWAEEQGLALLDFGEEPTKSTAKSHGIVTLQSSYDLDPSPFSPTDDSCWKQLTKTLQRVFGEETIVAPTMEAGNTDTRYYWDLTKNIYRMTPFRASHDPRGTRIHTVDERMPVAGLKELVDFYLAFIEDFDTFRG